VQAHGERGELAHGLLGARLRLGAALLRDRADDLREEPDLALGRGAERAQVPALEAEPRELGATILPTASASSSYWPPDCLATSPNCSSSLSWSARRPAALSSSSRVRRIAAGAGRKCSAVGALFSMEATATCAGRGLSVEVPGGTRPRSIASSWSLMTRSGR